MKESPDIIIGLDAGTSFIKAVAFGPDGQQIASSSIQNTYMVGKDGAVTQSMDATWATSCAAIVALGRKVEGLPQRTLGIAVTGQGDGTWLVDKDNRPVGDAWLWLDARAAGTVERLILSPLERNRFQTTGTGLNTCQQGAQLAHMKHAYPDLFANADCALHCKDWLYLCLTGVRVTDPSEASMTFGDFRTRQYDDKVVQSLGLEKHSRLLPQILDGTKTTHALSSDAAQLTSLLTGTPVILGFVDMIMTAFGAGVLTGDDNAACSVIGSTGVHLKARRAHQIKLGEKGSGYALCLPHEDYVAQTQTNMATTLNIDWLLSVGADLVGEFGPKPSHRDMIGKLNSWLSNTAPSALLYHPYISEAGERGPFLDAHARANFAGLNTDHRFPDMARSVIEGIGLAARDCFLAMGELPDELRITGGAANAPGVRKIISAAVGAPIRVSERAEAGAAGCAMMAAVALGVYDDMDVCIQEWVVPHLAAPEQIDEDLAVIYQQKFRAYQSAQQCLQNVWPLLGEPNA